jgi:hypothetical protein
MARHVYPSREVAHLWANRATSHDIRNSNDSMRTIRNGSALCSYGDHFVIGAFLTHPRTGAALNLWNASHYSSTTNRHQSHARHALPYATWQTFVHVPKLKACHLHGPDALREVSDACITSGVASLEKSRNARQNRPGYLRTAADWFDSARAIRAWCGDRRAVPTFAPDADKPAIAALLQTLQRGDYLESAREHLSRARVRSHGASMPERWQVAAQSRIDSANMAIQNAETSAGYYRKAGSKPAPECARIVATMSALVRELQPVADRERAESDHRILSNAAGSVHAYMRARRIARTSPGRFDARRNRSDVGAWEWERAKQNVRDVSGLRMPDQWQALAKRYALSRAVDSLARCVTWDYVTSSRQIRLHVADIAQLAGADSAAARYWSGRAGPMIAAALEREAREREEARAKAAAAIAEWRAGGRVYLGYDVPTMARIRGDVVETSRGASVPLLHACRLVRIAQRIAQRGGQQWEAGEGPRVGHYQVQRIGADLSATIGCHEFAPEESARIVADILAHPAYVGAAADAGVTQ